MAEKLIKLLFEVGPILFAIGFLVPLVIQFFELIEISSILGFSSQTMGIVFAATWGVVAQLRGRWI